MYILIINVIKEIKDMKKKSNKKGFTIMEMLIVVAIIAVLAAIAIPVFNGALTKSKEAADVANIRAAYAEVMVATLTDNTDFPNKAGFVAKVQGGLNYEGNLAYTPDTADKTDHTITYTAKRLTNSKTSNHTFTWTMKSDSYTDTTN